MPDLSLCELVWNEHQHLTSLMLSWQIPTATFQKLVENPENEGCSKSKRVQISAKSIYKCYGWVFTNQYGLSAI